MEKERLSMTPRFLGILLLSAPVLPAWGEPPVQKEIYSKVVLVGQSGGDYTSPTTAMAKVASWCGTPSRTNGCLVKILPGVYDLAGESLTMQPFVDIEGSGETATTITSAVASSSEGVKNGLVNGADNAELRSLTVKNAAVQGEYIVAIANNSKSPRITHVTALASGGHYACGIYNSASSPTISNVTASASDGDSNYGIYNTESSPAISNVTASGNVYAFTNCGVYNSASSPTMSNVAASGTNGHFNYGVYNDNSSSPKMSNVTVSSNGTNSYAVYNSYSSPAMSNVTVTSSDGTNVFGIVNLNSSPTMSNVMVTAWGGSGTFGVLNETSSPTLRNVTISASGGEYATGISNIESTPIMHNVKVYTPTPSGSAESNRSIAANQIKDIGKMVKEHSLEKLGALMGQ